jgi:hypothetical protein
MVVQQIHQRLLPGGTEPTADGVASRHITPRAAKLLPQTSDVKRRILNNRDRNLLSESFDSVCSHSESPVSLKAIGLVLLS